MKNATRYQRQARVMKSAWELFNDYDKEISFKDCLTTSWNIERGVVVNGVTKDTDVAAIKDGVYICTQSTDALHILYTVRDKSKSFHKDIAEKALNGMQLTEKQAWCVAYEYKKVA